MILLTICQSNMLQRKASATSTSIARRLVDLATYTHITPLGLHGARTSAEFGRTGWQIRQCPRVGLFHCVSHIKGLAPSAVNQLHPNAKVTAILEPWANLHGTPRVQEVKQVARTWKPQWRARSGMATPTRKVNKCRKVTSWGE